jgi:hypothetical protein
MSSATAAPQPLNRQFAALLAATLETWAHQLLFQRHIYPRETFGPTRFLGVRCQACRHPGVVSYIADTVGVAVPALMTGAADVLSLVVTTTNEDSDHVDDDSHIIVETVVETYSLKIVEMLRDWRDVGSNVDIGTTMQELERAMRDLVLRVLSLESERASSSDTVSFKLTLHLPEENRSCNELNHVFAEGTWFCPPDEPAPSSASVFSSKSIQPREWIRPLHRLSTPNCVIDFAMRKSKDDRKAPPKLIDI